METSKKQKKWSKAMVIYHWLAAIVILGLLLTGIAHMTVLDPHDIVQSISKIASAQGIAISHQLERVVGFTINSALMNIHFILGYTLGFLILFRIVLFFTGDTRVFKMAKKIFYPWHFQAQTVSKLALYRCLSGNFNHGCHRLIHEIRGDTGYQPWNS